MIICTGLLTNLSELVSGTGIVSAMLLFVGLMLIVIEFYQPAWGVATYCGITLTICGIVVRMLAGGTFVMLFFMVFFCALVLCGAHAVMLITQKKKWLTQALALRLENAINDDDDGYSYLLGRDGLATTDISGSGHMLIDDVNFFVTSSVFIPKGSVARVTNVTGDSIEVQPVSEESEN